ncbi:B2M isoform 7 [Pan troglodytes]|uniref:Beta-2-microglobulin n=2 Tax=Homininae TaxID=207598 RepID=J3KNU0_HUMAN|nr:beta-2-microglobulin [Homo sapiens]KAI4057582.1 beta-2-microglobulin [Homo sapiens]PNI75126.1 B2M isoform 7 [Pan troglodytes]
MSRSVALAVLALLSLSGLERELKKWSIQTCLSARTGLSISCTTLNSPPLKKMSMPAV